MKRTHAKAAQLMLETLHLGTGKYVYWLVGLGLNVGAGGTRPDMQHRQKHRPGHKNKWLLAGACLPRPDKGQTKVWRLLNNRIWANRKQQARYELEIHAIYQNSTNIVLDGTASITSD